MDTTVFLAQIWGPALLAVGLGIFVSRAYYLKLYRNLQNEMLAVLTFGLASIMLGILHIGAHNAWDTLSQVIISLLGWGLLLKGALFVIAPGFVDKAGDFEAKSKLIPVVGVLTLVIGVYLAWVGYF